MIHKDGEYETKKLKPIKQRVDKRRAQETTMVFSNSNEMEEKKMKNRAETTITATTTIKPTTMNDIENIASAL